ncbi:MAG: hypothetical protein AAFW00_14510 [Bacteroidota bacterium]
MNPEFKELHQLNFYRVFRIIVLAFTALVFGVKIIMDQGITDGPLFVWMLFPAVTPFIHWVIFQEDRPHYATVQIAMLAGFLGIGFIMAPYTALIMAVGLLVLGLLTYNFTRPQIPEELQVVDAFREAPQPSQTQQIPLEHRIREKIEQLKRERQDFDRKARRIEELLDQNEGYLQNAKHRLNESFLNEDTRHTTEQLVKSLETQGNNYKLLISFFQKVSSKYDKEEQNLMVQLENLEIIAFLNKNQDEAQNLTEVEQTLLDIQFEEEIHRILTKLNLEDEIPLNFQGEVPTDLRHQLEEAIEKLA